MIKKVKKNSGNVERFAQSNDLCWLVSSSRDLDEELQELREDVSRLYVASYPGINPLPTLFAFFSRENKFKIFSGM